MIVLGHACDHGCACRSHTCTWFVATGALEPAKRMSAANHMQHRDALCSPKQTARPVHAKSGSGASRGCAHLPCRALCSETELSTCHPRSAPALGFPAVQALPIDDLDSICTVTGPPVCAAQRLVRRCAAPTARSCGRVSMLPLELPAHGEPENWCKPTCIDVCLWQVKNVALPAPGPHCSAADRWESLEMPLPLRDSRHAYPLPWSVVFPHRT